MFVLTAVFAASDEPTLEGSKMLTIAYRLEQPHAFPGLIVCHQKLQTPHEEARVRGPALACAPPSAACGSLHTSRRNLADRAFRRELLLPASYGLTPP